MATQPAALRAAISGWVLLALLLGCAGGGSARFWFDTERRLVVAGPMVGPFDSLMALAPELCKVVRQMPGATAGNTREGQEYCGVIYQRNFESSFYASHPSTLSHPLPLPGGRKSCKPPERVEDPDARTINIYADYHSHPAITGFSPEDLQARTQRYYFRLMFNPVCEVRLYDFQERTVFLLEAGQFVPVKRITDDLRGQ
ncbi:hypothetical protein D7X30_02660 [Corallococcus sp. AB011P]|nr:hypothetical protein D7X30_02660 [Corallococcus sp. AB011P]RKH81657.1 hypothetical protein D7Y21_29915 [Corallococcus sp. AB045]